MPSPLVGQAATIRIDTARVSDDALLQVEGFAVAARPIERIQVFLGHSFLGLAERGGSRADIGLALPHERGAAWSGFRFLGDVAHEDLSGRIVHARALLADGAAIRASAAVDSSGLGAAGLRHPQQPPAASIQALCEHAVPTPGSDIWSVSGWAFCLAGIASIDLAIDDGEAVAAVAGLDRPDIGNRFPRIPGARHAGFAFHGQLGPATARVLQLRIRPVDGPERVLQHRPGQPARAATMAARGVGRDLANRMKFFLDRPASVDGTAHGIAGVALSVQGWAVARHGIAAVELGLDGAPLGAAARGLHRPEIGRAFPEWPDADRSGFALTIPAALMTGRHRLRLLVRDRTGAEAITECALIAARAPPVPTTLLRTRVAQAEIDLNAAILRGLGQAPHFAVTVLLADAGAAEIRRARETLRSLREQVFSSWSARFLLPPDTATLRLDDAEIDMAQIAVAESGRLLAGPATHRLVLRAGDRLGCDALMEFAVAASQAPRADFVYADERRRDPTDGTVAADLRPQWSPDLLLSTDYIGRSWCAEAGLVEAAGITEDELFQHGPYDLVLRLTERAGLVRHAPAVLLDTSRTAASTAAGERAALRRAVQRRGLDATVEPGLAPGLHRVRRAVAATTVSIVLPTCGSRGLFRTAIESLRRTADLPIELVVVDNLPAGGGENRAEDRAWLRRHADRIVAMPGPFNWSRFNNAGAAQAGGDVLLFLNDDIKASAPHWLTAMVEQVLRPEIGAVGARLLYPDGTLQHVGIGLSPVGGLHPFRFLSPDAAGGFGRAASLREVSAVTGACLMVRRDVFARLGGFDEAHPIINNDLDFCLRLRAAGLGVVCTPHATLVHHELASRAALGEVYDEARFDAVCGPALRRGDPYGHPHCLPGELPVPDPEPLRVLVAGRPLLAADRVRRILAVKLDHLGDFVTALPALRRLKQRFPAARLDVLCSPEAAGLVGLEPAIAAAIPFALFHARSARGRRRITAADKAALLARLAERLEGGRYDVVIDLRKHFETRPWLQAIGGRLLAGFDRGGQFPWLDVSLEWEGDAGRVGKRGPVGGDLLALVEAVAIACEPPPAALAVPPRGDGGTKLPPRTPGKWRVCVHPGAGGVLKQWPAAHFAALMDLLAEQGAECVLIGGPGDRRLAARVLARTRHVGVRSLVGEVSLAGLPDVLLGCDLFVGNDSGPKHLAAALGLPTVGIHSGVVDPAEWGPLGPRAVAVHRQMACSPCYLTKRSACPRDLACLQQVRPADVAAICRRMVASGFTPPSAPAVLVTRPPLPAHTGFADDPHPAGDKRDDIQLLQAQSR